MSLALALVLFSGMLSLLASAPARAESTTIEITDVYNAVNPSEEWFQLYNMTKSSLTLTDWSICTSTTCITLPTMTIDSFNLAKIKASSLSNWPAKGLDGANDMLGLKDNNGKPIDSLNWGTPSSSWKNYEAFQTMLWNPGIKTPDPNANQSFFRMAIGHDTDSPTDWLTTAQKLPGSTAQPTATPTSPIQPLTTPPAPKTGGEFPVLLALGLLGGLFAIRYLRRLAPQK